MSTRRHFVLGLFLSLNFAILTTFVANSLHPRFEHRAEAIGKEFAVVRGESYTLAGRPQYFPEFQNRVLFALALNALTSSDSPHASQVYLTMRLLTAIALFLTFWLLLTRVARADPWLAAVGLGLLAYEEILEFNHGWDHPSDFLDGLFAGLILWSTWRHKRLALVLITVLAAFSRESAVFAGAVWFFVHGLRDPRRPNVREMSFGVSLSVLAYAAVLGVRFWFGGPKALARAQTQNLTLLWPAYIKPFLKHPHPGAWPILLFAMLAVPGIWIWSNRAAVTAEMRGALLAAGAITLGSIALATVAELRIFMPMTPLLVFVAVSAHVSAHGAIRHREVEHFEKVAPSVTRAA